DVGRFAVPGREQRRTHRARLLALRSIHITVDRQRLLVPEQIVEGDRAVLAFERVSPGHLAAGRQGATLLRHTLDVATELDFLGEERVARMTIFVAFVREANP